ncbi:hypothetical protein AAC03nite_00890 [Alicyclobacillus acidoterrestris]|uniref:YfmQ family protein n=1 Tax=Alicyclobacillus suci TaxID=2816080 RepID=UPI00119096B9|nr:YfmQ family protein [Alicyclobacillus suci]GEO24304.1 hypothetical protein AAC03nite_00890 [Alicyclobacillus acidoterrestris]
MVFWIIMILLALHIIGAFFMSPPTAWADKFFNMFATHPKLKRDLVQSIKVNEIALEGEQLSKFVDAFQAANFLYEGGLIHGHDQNPITIQIVQAKDTFRFHAYLYGDGMVEMIRIKKNKHIPYRLRSTDLESELLSYDTTKPPQHNISN